MTPNPTEELVACDDCHGPVPSWFAPNDLWNKVMGGADAKDDPGGMLCVHCFIRRAEIVEVKPAAWRLDADADRLSLLSAEVATLTKWKDELLRAEKDQRQCRIDAEARAEALSAKLKEAEAALEPFASKADWPLVALPDGAVIRCEAIVPSYVTEPSRLASFGLAVDGFTVARSTLQSIKEG